MSGLKADLAHAGLSGHAANLSLIDSAAFFDRSYRYNRPPKLPLYGRAGEPRRSTTRVWNANEQVFQSIAALQQELWACPFTRLGDKT